ncbi:HTH-type transcriptional repressor FabR [Acinetobacter cumulans]|jgi:AcrR family transcriptional regulator|uniref:HTH-type transcriptional repressor FabR n=1 Tax=Acinetobacter cumulans TaxID=2136182 RepID=A0A498CXC5_9GAMM|nr:MULTISPECIES: HTH-type transcriptional repressor FabR [Acinetobacter]NWK73188.1 HTH-type transcriptional repressor FabR [Acinetobacter sp. SwsAc6]QCO21823.1 HTH-type transcriptional repressor FabR [Acinetobacter cumulans]RFS32703.1 HTH-type transcriptional repressor FabR [Acinetobacter sp. SWAC5]RKG43778.1 HTH-type transcriptional repressor FabR [Acinetobacter cumulans]RKG45937.1 HTH-type transcriptional repressor FabR [Acinetobacter cumulans]
MLQEQTQPEITHTVRNVGRKATITKDELFQAALNLIGPQKSIASLSLREVAREAGIAPNSFYRHFKDIDELAIELIDRAGVVLRQILHEARLKASKQNSIIRSSVEVFIQQLDADTGNLSLLLREGYTGSFSYKKAVERQLNFFQQELREDLIVLEKLNNSKLSHPDIAAKAITQLVFNMGAKVIDMPTNERTEVAEQTMIMIRMILEGARQLDEAKIR